MRSIETALKAKFMTKPHDCQGDAIQSTSIIPAARASSCDALIGGGQAGPVASALLAERGCRIEKWGAEFVRPGIIASRRSNLPMS